LILDQDEIELTLRDCCKYLLQQLCHECHYKFRLHKDNQKPRIPILVALRASFDQLLVLLNYTRQSVRFDLINDLCFNVALYHGDDIMLKYLQHLLTNKTPVSYRLHTIIDIDVHVLFMTIVTVNQCVFCHISRIVYHCFRFV
jgi:hypothetical protein